MCSDCKGNNTPDVTEALIALCHESSWKPDIEAVRQYVCDGANIFSSGSGLYESLLHTFIKECHVEGVRACLETASTLDFSVTGSHNQTVLHCLCQSQIENEDTAAMLRAIIERFETHPHDRINWLQRDEYGNDFLTSAAINQKLSLVWELVKDVPFFADLTDPIALTETVWRWDWENLGNEKVYFCLDDADIEEAERSTGDLVKLSRLTSPNIEKIKIAVSDGADVLYEDFQSPGNIVRVLHHFMWKGNVGAVKACYSTTRVIDFSVRDLYHSTAIRYIWYNSKTLETVTSLLQLTLERLLTHPDDHVDWNDVGSGEDIFSTSAAFGGLHILCRLFRQTNYPYYVSATTPFMLECKAQRADWEQLDKEDKQIICAIKGLTG